VSSGTLSGYAAGSPRDTATPRSVGHSPGRRAAALALLTCAALALFGCAALGRAQPRSAYDVGFRGPGRLLLVFEAEHERLLVVQDAGGVRRVAADAPRDARWVGRERLLVVSELPPTDGYGLPDTRVVLIDLASGEERALLGVGRHYDPEPSPDGRWLAIGADVGELGDSDLEIWSLEGEVERVAVRHQSVEEPRWRSDGRMLVASVLMADPESQAEAGGSYGSTAFSWPRLHRLRRDLGDPERLADGEAPDSLAPGGSLPLWWSDAGIYARQRRGLVRCDPEGSGCELVHAPGDKRRVVDGRAVGHEAWLLTVEASDAFDRRLPDEILRVDLHSGQGRVVYRAPEGLFLRDIDWIDGEAGPDRHGER
jgi:hypothetical protein